MTSIRGKLSDKTSLIGDLDLSLRTKMLIFEIAEFAFKLEANEIPSGGGLTKCLLDILDGIEVEHKDEVQKELDTKLNKLKISIMEHHPELYEKHMLAKCLKKLDMMDYPYECINAELIIEKLHDISKKLNLQFYEASTTDVESGQTITICGIVFVLDVSIKQPYQIENLELSYATKSIPRNAKADNLLANLLRMGKYQDFMHELKHICILDRDYKFELMNRIETGAFENFKLEWRSSDNKKLYILENLYYGMGLILENYDLTGLCFIYYTEPMSYDHNILDYIEENIDGDVATLNFVKSMISDKIFKSYLRLSENKSFFPPDEDVSTEVGLLHMDSKNAKKNLISNEDDGEYGTGYIPIGDDGINNPINDSSKHESTIKLDETQNRRNYANVEPNNSYNPPFNTKSVKPDSQQKGEPLYLLELKLYPDIILTDDIIREIYDAIQFDSVQLGFDANSFVSTLKSSIGPIPESYCLYEYIYSLISQHTRYSKYEEIVSCIPTHQNSSIHMYIFPPNIIGHRLYKVSNIVFYKINQLPGVFQILRRVRAFESLLKSCFNYEGHIFSMEHKETLENSEVITIEISEIIFGSKIVLECENKHLKVILIIGDSDKDHIHSYCTVKVECIRFKNDENTSNIPEASIIENIKWNNITKVLLNIPYLISSIINTK